MLNKWAMTAIVAVLAAGGVEHAAANGTSASTLLSEGVSLELGERDFINYCAACHGVGAKGDGTIGEFLTLAVPDLTELSKRNGGQFPEARVTEVIDGRAEVKVHGMRDMPVWGDWFDAEAASPDIDRKARELIVNDRIASLVLYLKSIQAP
jgi:hypothetical protein